MKIIFICPNHAPEMIATGKYQGEMAAWFAERGHDVRVVAAPPYYPAWKISPGYSAWQYKKERVDGTWVYRIPLYIPSAPNGLKRVICIATFTLFSAPVILYLALRWRPDVIMVTEPPLLPAPAATLAGWLVKARCHLHVQDFEVDAAFKLGILRNLLLYKIASGVERLFMKGFKTVSSISPRMRERLIAKGVAPENAFLVSNWSSVDDIDPSLGSGGWRERLGIAEGTIMALYSGNIGHKQGLDILVEAAKHLRMNDTIRFIICGDGAASQEIFAAVKAAALPNITFIPVQSYADFKLLLVAADIHMMPQRADVADLVMPSKLGNILASGRPMVAGAAKGTQVYDAIQGCGIAVEPDNGKDFAEAIAYLAANPALRQEMGAKARERALADWRKDAILTNFEHILLRSDSM